MPQCEKVLDNGERCKRTALKGSKYCWQHQGTRQSTKRAPHKKSPASPRVLNTKITPKKISSPKAARGKSKETNRNKEKHYLIFAEPMTYQGQRPESTIEVNNKMYSIIKAGPTEEFRENLPQNPKLIQHGFNENCLGNAYVFGPLFNRDEYSEIASHGNDVAGTGLIDLEINGYKPSMDYDFYDEVSQKYNYDWNNRELLKKFQEKYPGILWIGETYGGDIGASAYAHYDKNIEIDGLIIDTSCLIHE